MGCSCLKRTENEKLTEIGVKPHDALDDNDQKNKTKSEYTEKPPQNVESTQRESKLKPESIKEEANSNVIAEQVNQKEDKKAEAKKEDDNAIPDKSFEAEILCLINKVRANPRSYADKIEDSVNFIQRTKDKIIYNDRVKVKLEKGEDAFNEASEALRVIHSMEPLVFKKELCVKPPETKEQHDDKNYVSHQIELINSQISVKSNWTYQVDVPDVSLLLMIVSDTKSAVKKKRNDLLNPAFKYIGISSASFGKTFTSYFTFAN